VTSKLRLFRALRRDVEIIVKPIMDVAHLEAVVSATTFVGFQQSSTCNPQHSSNVHNKAVILHAIQHKNEASHSR
jgi:hypothetical protein